MCAREHIRGTQGLSVTLPSKSLRRPTDQGQTFPSGLEHRGAGLRLFQYLVCSGVQAAGRQRAYSKVLEVCLSRWPLQMGRTGQLMWQLQPPWGGDSASVLSGHVSPATGQGHSGRAAPTAGGPWCEIDTAPGALANTHMSRSSRGPLSPRRSVSDGEKS